MDDNAKETEAIASESESSQETSPVDKSSLAWKIFDAFISGTDDMEATEEELMDYAVKDLKIDVSKLPPPIVEKVPLILIAFMNTWSGWLFKSEFLAGKFKKQHYFNRFHKYMTHKVKILNSKSFVNSTLSSISNAMSEKYKSVTKSTGKPSSNTIVKQNPDFSQYAISIQCPAYMLNTIVFSNVGDDVIMKQHLGNTWQDLSTSQLVNWPNVEVSFRTQDLCFVRRQATDYVRYLNFLPHECKKPTENIIESIEPLNTYGRTKLCYTYRFLEEYVKEYISALKTVKNITGSKLEEIQTILGQFLEDIKHINMNSSMATNTVVLFRLSPVPFIRNKKLVKNPDKEGEDVRVGYCEIITPKVELVMLYFRAQQKDTPYISFEYPDKIKAAASNETNSIYPYIGYKCTFCGVEFNTGNTKKHMMEHLKKDHKMEQHVRCTVCKKQFDVLNLSACRWRHKCVASNSTVTVV